MKTKHRHCLLHRLVRVAAWQVAALLVVLGWTPKALPQTSPVTGQMQQVGVVEQGCRPLMRLPQVPQFEPRVGQGQQPADRWQTQQPADAAPTASLIEPLKGNDAVIQLIVGQGRLITFKQNIAGARGQAVIAVADPTIVDFEVLPNPRLLRLTAKRVGVTDLSVTTAEGQTFSFEVQVVYDLELLSMQLKQLFPDAELHFTQIREHLAVEGEARSVKQVDQIIQAIKAYLVSVQVPASTEGSQEQGRPEAPSGPSFGAPPAVLPDQQPSPSQPNAGEASYTPEEGQPRTPQMPAVPGQAAPEEAPEMSTKASFAEPQIINLIRVPGVQQVMLQVRIAELNRTGLREIGADILGVHPGTGNIFGTKIGGATVSAAGGTGASGITGSGSMSSSGQTSTFGIFPNAKFEMMLTALRENSLLTVLAEPNLVALSGQQASFLAGGEFPVPVPQIQGGTVGGITVMFKNFGVQLDFLPYVLDDETLRLTVSPEVSTIDYAVGTTLVVGGDRVPGVNTRRATTTVEMKQGQTLAIAGLLEVTVDGSTSRIPWLGDAPYLGPLFSKTHHERTEKELVVMVTPYLVSAMNPGQVPPLPGAEITDPNDLEFYLLNRISGRTDHRFLSSRAWDDPLHLVHLMKLERNNVCGPCGFSSSD